MNRNFCYPLLSNVYAMKKDDYIDLRKIHKISYKHIICILDHLKVPSILTINTIISRDPKLPYIPLTKETPPNYLYTVTQYKRKLYYVISYKRPDFKAYRITDEPSRFPITIQGQKLFIQTEIRSISNPNRAPPLFFVGDTYKKNIDSYIAKHKAKRLSPSTDHYFVYSPGQLLMHEEESYAFLYSFRHSHFGVLTDQDSYVPCLKKLGDLSLYQKKGRLKQEEVQIISEDLKEMDTRCYWVPQAVLQEYKKV